MKILILPGDGIGPEIVAQAVRVLERSVTAIWAALPTTRMVIRILKPRKHWRVPLMPSCSAALAVRSTTHCRARCGRNRDCLAFART